MNLPRFSVEHSLFVNLLSLALIIGGVVVFPHMPKEAFPNIDFDIVMIQTAYPGSTAQEIEKLITIPIEDELREEDGIDEVSSVSVEGLSMIVVQLDPDLQATSRTITNIQRAVDRVIDLPRDAKKPVVTELRSQDQPILTLSLRGKDIWELRTISRETEERVEEIPGVARVDKLSWPETEVWVSVDPEKLKTYHLSLDEVSRALRDRNSNVPGGKFYLDSREHLIRTVGEFETPQEIETVVIRANDQGNWLTVGDVATAAYALEDKDELHRINGEASVNLLVVKKANADILKTVKAVNDAVESIRSGLPDSASLIAVNELTVKYVQRRLRILVNNASVGIVFVTLILLLFLSPRVAVLAALGIPLSFCITGVVMSSMGMTINLLTMFGMIIVLGMIVDDAIVVAENIFRYIERGVPVKEAAVRGATEVARPVTATILTSVAAFGPLMFMGGIMGKFVWVIPAVVIISLLASLFESVVILPSHIADFVKPVRRQSAGERAGTWFLRLRRTYMFGLKHALKHRWWVLFGVCAAFVVSVGIVASPLVKVQFFPSRGIEAFFVRFHAPVGTSLAELSDKVMPLEAAVGALPDGELDYFVSNLGLQREGTNEPAGLRGSHVGQLLVYLKSDENRRRKAHEIMEALRSEVGDIDGLDITFESVRPGPPVGKPVSIAVRGDDFGTLRSIAEEFKAYLATVPGVTDIDDDYKPGKQEFRVRVNERAAKRAGVSFEQVGQAVRSAYAGTVATTIKRTDEEIRVLVRFPEESRRDPASLDALVVENARGDLIPLARIAAYEQQPGVSDIKHLDYKRVIRVTAQIDERVTSSTAVNRQVMRAFRTVGQRYPGYTVRYGGEQEDTMESMENLFRAMLLAVMGIYAILAVALNSLTLPVLVLAPVPFGLIGVVIAFMLHQLPLSFMALLGVVGLTGVVVNDAILMVDFIQRERKRKPLLRSIVAAARTRFRPVILTTVTTAVGLAPVAYGIGGLDPFLQPAALALTWGLVFATLLTLIYIPCLYSLAEDERGLRLGALAIDLALLTGPTAFLILFAVRQIGLLYMAGFIALQIFLLLRRGQTLGKRVAGLRIDAVGGQPAPSFVRMVLLRLGLPLLCLGVAVGAAGYAVQGGLGAVERVGAGVVALAALAGLLADSLSIFGATRRTLHDRFAGTRVVRV